MAKYKVRTKQIFTVDVEVEADSGEQAIELVAQGNGCEDPDSITYVDILDQNTWQVVGRKG